jgi:hypothetical protein
MAFGNLKTSPYQIDMGIFFGQNIMGFPYCSRFSHEEEPPKAPSIRRGCFTAVPDGLFD